jgi:hypothetical protein
MYFTKCSSWNSVKEQEFKDAFEKLYKKDEY